MTAEQCGYPLSECIPPRIHFHSFIFTAKESWRAWLSNS